MIENKTSDQNKDKLINAPSSGPQDVKDLNIEGNLSGELKKKSNESQVNNFHSIEVTVEEGKSNVFAEGGTEPNKSSTKKNQSNSKQIKKLRTVNKKITRFQNKNITLIEDIFGYIKDENSKDIPIKRFTWTNHNNVEAQIITYGARIISLKIPDKQGHAEDVVLGFDNLESYVEYGNFMFGATIGRVSGPVENSTFVIDGKQYWLKANQEQHCVDGGIEGLHKVIWNASVNKTKVILTHLSPDNHEGFPGEVLIAITFELSTKNEFSINMEAISTKPTIINLSNLCYFNLSGHGGGHDELYKHIVTINSHSYSKMDDNNLPTGDILNSVFTKYDFQTPTLLRRCMGFDDDDGFDQNFCINRDDEDICFVGRALHIPSGRTLELYSNQYGVRFDTGNKFGPASSLRSLIKSKSFDDWPTLHRIDSSALTNNQQNILMLLLNIYQKMKDIHDVNENNFHEILELLIEINLCNLDHVKALFVSTTMFKQATLDVKVVIAAVIKSIQLIQYYIPPNIASVRKWIELEGTVERVLFAFRNLDDTVKTFTHKVSVDFHNVSLSEAEVEAKLQELQVALTESANTITPKASVRSRPSSIKSTGTTPSMEVNEEWLKEQLQSKLFHHISEQLSKSGTLFKTQSKESALIGDSLLSNETSVRQVPSPPTYVNLRIIGKSNFVYSRHCGMAFQTQNYPNAIYHRNFPNCILKPNETYSHKIIYKFWVQSGNPKRWLNREFP